MRAGPLCFSHKGPAVFAIDRSGRPATFSALWLGRALQPKRLALGCARLLSARPHCNHLPADAGDPEAGPLWGNPKRDASRRLGRGASRHRLSCIGRCAPAGAFLAVFVSLNLPIG